MTRFSPVKSIVVLMMFGLFVTIGSFACSPPANNEQTNSDASTTDTGGNADTGNTDTGGGGKLSYAKDIWPLFEKTNCKNCHGTSGGVAIDGPNNLAALLDKKGNAGKVLVKAGDPAGSYLLEKLKPSPSAGKIMPLGGTPLSSDDVKKVEDWIKQGANP